VISILVTMGTFE